MKGIVKVEKFGEDGNIKVLGFVGNLRFLGMLWKYRCEVYGVYVEYLYIIKCLL